MKPMPSKPFVSRQAIIAILVVLAVAGGAYLLRSRRPKPESDLPPGAIYYFGPMKQKGGSVYATEDGRVVPPPPGG